MQAGRGGRRWWVGAAAVALTLTAAQDPAAPSPSQAPTPPADGADLQTLYLFRERYVAPGGEAPPGAIGDYRVAFRETLHVADDQPQGAPKVSDASRRWVYSERAARIDDLAQDPVAAVVRRYEAVEIRPAERTRAGEPPMLQGLSLWVEPQPMAPPQIVSLTPGRELRVGEYNAAYRQILVPDLAGVLPAAPVRAGDSWPVRSAAAMAIVGKPVKAGVLDGKLLAVRDAAESPGRIAEFAVTGRVSTVGPGGSELNTAVNARLEFAFVPAPAQPFGGLLGPGADEPVTAADGAFTSLRLAQTEVGDIPEAEGQGRFRRNTNRTFILERRLGPVDPPLDVPDASPELTPENSWLTFEGPQGHYRLRFPQTFLFDPRPQPSPATIGFVRPLPDGEDTLKLTFYPEARLDPDTPLKARLEAWGALGIDVAPAASEWLPEADWPGLRVHREQTTLTTDAEVQGSNRIDVFSYTIQTGRQASLYFEASTTRQPPEPFRDEVEAILHTLRFDVGSSPATPSAPESPPRRMRQRPSGRAAEAPAP